MLMKIVGGEPERREIVLSTINVGVVNEAQVYNTSCASKQV